MGEIAAEVALTNRPADNAAAGRLHLAKQGPAPVRTQAKTPQLRRGSPGATLRMVLT